MTNELTHASFFSGVGGLDMGLGRAGWRTVSFSEIDPYASAVLAERWPGVPNLGDITGLGDDDRTAQRDPGRRGLGDDGLGDQDRPRSADSRDDGADGSADWQRATLWSGGFPCQDLSVAGKRAGFEGKRSVLAFSFLALVERYRPPAVLLENVPGLLSSHDGRDMAELIRALVELGYGVGYRTLDARHFGVPQRRRRVFIVGLTPGGRAGAERAAEVLSVGSRCDRHSAPGLKARKGAPTGSFSGPGEPEYLRQSVNSKWAKGYSGPAGDEHHNLTLGPVSTRPYDDRGHENGGLLGAPVDPDGDGGPHGLAAGAHDRPQLEATTGPLDAADQATAAALVRVVWPTAGEEAVQREAGRLSGFPAQEVLRYAVHGAGLRPAAVEGDESVGEDRELSRAQTRAERAVLDLREAERARRASSERRSERQSAGELGQALSGLPSPSASVRGGMNDPDDDDVARPLLTNAQGGQRTTDLNIPLTFAKQHRAASVDDYEGWSPTEVAPTLNDFDSGDARAVALAVGSGEVIDDPMLPLGLDSHRYRCCGNGVVSDVAEWIGMRLAEALA